MSLTRSDSQAKRRIFFRTNRTAPSPGLVPDPHDNMTPARRHLHTRKYPPTHHETLRLRPKKQMKSEIISQSFGGEYFIFISFEGGALKMCSGACVGGFIVVFSLRPAKKKMKRTAANLGQGVMSISSTIPDSVCRSSSGTSRRCYIRRMFDVRRKPDGLRAT